ncbi:GAF protein [Apiospora phragmitis]|uniref:GAF protein n=1 Tax=Apiospora phragmitis TaxID=2905665 RepID=A0ABR1TQ38_9PEZI
MVSALECVWSRVHADASNFAEGVTKQQAYDQVLLQAEGLFDGQRNWHPCQLGRYSVPPLLSLYRNSSRPLSHHVNPPPFTGFYTLDASASPEKPRLILGPFQGKVACQTIYFGRGVCGAAASTRTTQLVRDVEQFPGHIACDGDSKSEIVVPIVVDDKVVAIIDIDCAVLEGFDDIDQAALEKLAALLARSCDWS